MRYLRLTGIVLGGFLALVIGLVAAVWIWAGGNKVPPGQIAWGLTYSSGDAKGLGLDPKATYIAILDQLHPKRLRLAAYWTDIEPSPGQFDYSDLDFQTSEAEKRGIPYTIVVGRKVPRWPECYTPAWAKSLPLSQQQAGILNQISHTISRFNSNPQLVRWQVENEPYFIFGDHCPGLDVKFLHQEVDLARNLSHKQIMLTDSGEASNWLGASQWADVFGSTLYRVVLNPQGKPFHHFLWPEVYTRHANLIKKLHPNVKQVVIAELQGEPWSTYGLTNIPDSYRDLTLSHRQFTANIDFAAQVGFPEVYLWGAEWWYFEKLHGDPYYWNTAAHVFDHSAP
jgi:hypothetical protein